MSKTTPVRWWRDDAERYQSRPLYVVPPMPRLEWAFDLIGGPMDPGLLPAMQRFLALQAATRELMAPDGANKIEMLMLSSRDDQVHIAMLAHSTRPHTRHEDGREVIVDGAPPALFAYLEAWARARWDASWRYATTRDDVGEEQ